MRPFDYHDGQRAVQREANSVACADKLSGWVGPVAQFAERADLVVLASSGVGGFTVAALSGPPPLVTAESPLGGIVMRLPAGLTRLLPSGSVVGGILINPAEARRARISGTLEDAGNALSLSCETAFTNCRKYMTPTESSGVDLLVGPGEVRQLALSDPWVAATIDAGETAFLLTATPGGVADVSHRGGAPGFLRHDLRDGTISWTEYLGDGMFVSTGNLRSDRRFALIVLDFATGDALRLDGEADYGNLRTDRRGRVDALIQAGEQFPVQGRMRAKLHSAARLADFCHPRRRVEQRKRITSADSTEVQHPQ